MPGIGVATTMIRKKGKLGAILFGVHSTDVRTDATGVATFDWLPAGLQDSVSFHSASPGYFLPGWPTLNAEKPDTELKARVLRSGRVSGKVTMPDGSPAPGILVAARGWVGTRAPYPHSAEVRTADDGSYSMELPPGASYMIGVADEEWAARSQRGVIVREGVARTGIDLTLESGSEIRGRVTFESDAKPAPGRSVKIVEHGPAILPGLHPPRFAGKEEDLVRYAETDEAGRFALRVGLGTYTINEPDVDFEDGPVRLPRLTIVAGRDVEQDFTIPADDPPWKTVRGIVRDRTADGPPIADARLVMGARYVMGAFGVTGPDAYGDTDELGRFEMPGPTGKAFVYAHNPEGSLAGYAVVEDKDDRDLTIVVGPAATARGRVVDEKGKPWVSVTVDCTVEVGSGSISLHVLTDDDGRFTAPGLPPGSTCLFDVFFPGIRDDLTPRFEVKFDPTPRVEVKDAQPYEVPPIVVRRPIPLPVSPDPP